MSRGLLPSVIDVASDRVPPNSVEAEEALLGALMLSPDLYCLVKAVQPGWFYVTAHQHIYRAIQKLSERGALPEITAVAIELEDLGKLEESGGQRKIAEIAGRSIGSYAIEHYADIVFSKWLRREIIGAGNKIQQLAWTDGSDADLIMRASSILGQLARVKSADWRDLGAIAVDYCQELQGLISGESQPWTKTGFVDLDEACQLEYDTLTLVAGRPGMGKSVFAANVALNVALSGKQVLFVGLEMTGSQLMRRWIASSLGIPLPLLKKGKGLESHQLDRIEQLLGIWSSASTSGNLLFVGPSEVNGCADVCAKILQKTPELHANPGLIVIDHIHCLGNGYQEMSAISAMIQGELRGRVKAPIMAIAQLNRPPEQDKTNPKRPRKTDLRDSGRLEQDADNILLLHRPEYYDENTPDRGVMEVIIDKQREGELSTVKLLFEGAFSRLRNLAKGY